MKISFQNSTQFKFNAFQVLNCESPSAVDRTRQYPLGILQSGKCLTKIIVALRFVVTASNEHVWERNFRYLQSLNSQSEHQAAREKDSSIARKVDGTFTAKISLKRDTQFGSYIFIVSRNYLLMQESPAFQQWAETFRL